MDECGMQVGTGITGKQQRTKVGKVRKVDCENHGRKLSGKWTQEKYGCWSTVTSLLSCALEVFCD